MSRLLIVSNRLPFSVAKTDAGFTVRQSSGGLVSALKSYLEKDTGHFSEQLWIGTADVTEEEWLSAKETIASPGTFGIEPVFADKELYSAFYNGFSNATLWPLFHYFPSLVSYNRDDFSAYMKVARIFAQKLAAIYRPGDVIWIHDYQLMALPQMLRTALPQATIGFFLHIPFPSYEIFRLLPTGWKRSLLQGLLGADLIGFHTQEYVQHFVQSVKMVLQVESHYNTVFYNGRTIKTDLFPIGIDYSKFSDATNSEEVRTVQETLAQTFAGKKVIFSVDRLDYTKGLNYRLDAYEAFLEQFPQWHEEVVFVFNVVPSRDEIQAYMDRKRLVEEKISTINGRFSTLGWQPILYRYNHLSFEELCALYALADVALITPLRDGMNLVAKEFVACCKFHGVLVLSELTGAASELPEALLVNPTDTTEVVSAILQALTMPQAEQEQRLQVMQSRLQAYDVHQWINDFLTQLEDAKKAQEKGKINLLNEATVKRMLADFSKAERRCILLDYDGTLTPIQKLPQLAKPSDALLQLLERLAMDETTEIAVISGRDSDTLQGWLGHLPLTLVAEHGACIRYKGEGWQQLTTHPPAWKGEIRPMLQLFTARCPGSFVEEKKNTLAWHYRNMPEGLGFTRSRELRNNLLQITANTPLQVIDGNKVIEVRLMGVDKGTTALSITQHFDPQFCLCIGDDTTDEDMFRALRQTAYTVKIGGTSTAAQYSLPSQTEVLPLLRQFLIATQQTYGYSQV